MAQKLERESELRGHSGCVNRLAWNLEGTWLASASDDRKVMLWAYPDTECAPLAVETHHQANIFGVQFLPESGNRQLVTGAMDCSVQCHRLDACPDMVQRSRRQRSSMRRHRDASTVPVPVHSTVYNCHTSRVKAVEVEPSNPHMFWSAAEDGTVRQFDLRCSTNAQNEPDSANVLLEVKEKRDPVELKSLAINKVRPFQLAIASADKFVRCFDRRMMSTSAPDTPALSREAMLKLAPPHMCLAGGKQRPLQPHTTHVHFAHKGDKLLASYHADHAYAFDLQGTGSLASAALPPKAEEAKNEGNRAFFDKDNSRAIWEYSRALQYAPTSPQILANRAAAYLQRGWLGDGWCALQDCEAALRLDPAYLKAHYRRVQAIKALGQLQLANAAADQFMAQFPDHREDVVALKAGIRRELEERSQRLAFLRQGRSQGLRQTQWQDARMRQRQAAIAAARAAAAEMQSPAAAGRPPSPPSLDGDQASSDPAVPSHRTGPAAPTREEADSGRDSAETGHSEEAMESASEAELETDDAAAAQEEGWICDEHCGTARLPRQAFCPSSVDLRGTQRLWASGVGAQRMLQRYVGHCNVQTDIKEACYLGSQDELVASGSDDGRVFIYSAATGCAVIALEADEDVLLRATNPALMQALAENPQLVNMLMRRAGSPGTDEAGEDDDGEGRNAPVSCRVN
ncbi:hypothetical protein WJX72_004300 [[Myrmecia] bisecta]|uniref:WD and tetratricopeptide repeats protein 1 n=1 Tax=[Myrmecia] bisecta TaxID=41462 RepID=A0AAW1QQ54_9CHLO